MPEIQVNLNHNIPRMLTPLNLQPDDFHIERGDVLVVRDSTGVTQEQLDDVAANYDNTPYERELATANVDKEATAQIEKIVTPNQQRLLLARALHGIGTLLVQKQLITPEEFQQAAGPGLQAFGQAEQILADAERKKTEL